MTGDLEQIRLLESIEELTSKDGRFEFLGLALDVRYAVIAKRKGFAFAKSDVLELVENDPDHEVELSLSKGWSISGRVYTSEGEPLRAFSCGIDRTSPRRCGASCSPTTLSKRYSNVSDSSCHGAYERRRPKYSDSF